MSSVLWMLAGGAFVLVVEFIVMCVRAWRQGWREGKARGRVIAARLRDFQQAQEYGRALGKDRRP